MTRPSETEPVHEIRCKCGKLLARQLDADTIELMCQRCHKRIELSITQLAEGPVKLDL